MIESYQHEVIRKRRASRIFWGVVFFFAGFLFFFFQGYYPSIDFSFREIFSTGGVRRPDISEIIKSFGIINVSVKPKDATLILGSGSYASDEKRMTNYGTYSLLIAKTGYISDTVGFTIDRETPYYIDIVNLLPRPSYIRVGTGMSNIAKIRDNEWTAHTASGLLLMDESFSGGVLISSRVLTHIGEGYFLSGKTLVTYDEGWERKIWSGSSSFLSSCGGGVRVQGGYLSCRENKELLTEKGKIFTGVISIGNDYVKNMTALLVGPTLTVIAFTGAEDESLNFIEKDGIWYSQSGGTFFPLRNNKTKESITPINTGFDMIEYSLWKEGELIIIGKKGGSRFLIFLDPEGKTTPKYISFPEVTLDEVRIEKIQGNLFFKMKGSLLFLYHNSDQIIWIVDGEIVAFATENALYNKDGVIWRADWSEKK